MQFIAVHKLLLLFLLLVKLFMYVDVSMWFDLIYKAHSSQNDLFLEYVY